MLSSPSRSAAGLLAVALAAVLAVTACGNSSSSSSGGGSGAVKLGLITKTETNPFFVKMKEGADKEARAKGATLMSAALRSTGPGR